jgi:hypothetical protein
MKETVEKTEKSVQLYRYSKQMKPRPIFDENNKIFNFLSSSFFINSDKYSKLRKEILSRIQLLYFCTPLTSNLSK